MELDSLASGIVPRDVLQLALPLLEARPEALEGKPLLYHGACHCEWAGVHKVKGQAQLLQALSAFCGAEAALSPGCCGESGMGAMTSPQIYNVLRQRKRQRLEEAFEHYDGPVVVGCPSCKIGIGRTLIAMHDKRPVLHSAEWLAQLLDGEDWRHAFRKKVNETRGDVRTVIL